MPRRIAVALLTPPAWTPPGIHPYAWRLAMAEDVLDVLATMAEVEAGVAVPGADAALLRHVGWPGLRSYVLTRWDVASVFAALAADGYDQGVLLAGDAPDLPGMLIAKLLRPLTSHPVAAAAASGAAATTSEAATGAAATTREATTTAATATTGATAAAGPGLLGLSARLPAPRWLPAMGLDELTPQALRRLAPRHADVAAGTGWHRLRGPADLDRLDPRLEGWDATRALLGTGHPAR